MKQKSKRQGALSNSQGHTNQRTHRAIPRGPPAFGDPKFSDGLLFEKSLDIVRINSKITCVCVRYNKLNKDHKILSQHHSRLVRIWVTKLVNYVLLDCCLQMSSLSTLSLCTWEGLMTSVSPGAKILLITFNF